MNNPDPPRLGLYVHTPWCEHKCPYCDFNSHTIKRNIDQKGYIQALVNDLEGEISRFGDELLNRSIDSIFIGGGTPSLFDGHSYHELFSQIRARLPVADNCEITLEANPGSSEIAKFSAFLEAGVNRLSIGVQSFNQLYLAKLGRIHNANDAVNAAKIAQKAGFDNVNLDLMFGLPEQQLGEAIADVEQAIELHPKHLSCYQLTIEPNTLFYHHPPVTPDNDALWEMQTAIQQRLSDHNYQQYEVSAYAQPDLQCQHNLNYWQFGDYLGIGAGAHGKFTTSEKDVIRRWKVKHPNAYLNTTDHLGGESRVEQADLIFEFMLNALRLKQGFTFEHFSANTGLQPATIQPILDQHRALGLIHVSETSVKPTNFGFQHLNKMQEDYLRKSPD